MEGSFRLLDAGSPAASAAVHETQVIFTLIQPTWKSNSTFGFKFRWTITTLSTNPIIFQLETFPMTCFMRRNLHKVALRIRQYFVLDCSACTVACFPVQRSIFRERTSTWRCFLPVRKYWTRSSFGGSCSSSRWNRLHEIPTTPVKLVWEEGHHLFRAPTAKLVLALLLAWGWNIGNNVLFVRNTLRSSLSWLFCRNNFTMHVVVDKGFTFEPRENVFVNQRKNQFQVENKCSHQLPWKK